MNDMLKNLNENQRAAVLHTEGPLLILAGAGSGKTRVITNRIMHLIREKGVPPYRIFAVTFTNKAAEEMRNRITDLTGPEGKSVFIKTFHSASVYMLRRFGETIGIPSNFSIYDGADQAAVIKEILLNLKLDPKKIKPAMLASKISEVKDKTSAEGGDPSLHMQDSFAFDFTEIYTKYHEKLASNNALDFNDLLIKTVELLKTRQDVLQSLQRQWQYFMIDEYQDTNHSQYLIAGYLASAGKNICVVGDDDQSIYSWRGADIRNILDFEKDYPGAKVITLSHNYRSTEPILRAASSVISNNSLRKKKEIIAARGDGEPVVCCTAGNEYAEADFVVNTIVTLKYREKFTNSDFAVFYRTNAQSRIFEEMLRKQNLPYKVIGGLKFYDRKEIKDIVSYLRFIQNTSDEVALQRIINTPARGIGKATLDRILETAASSRQSAWQVIKSGSLTGRIPAGLESFRKLIVNTEEMLKDVPGSLKLSAFVNELINQSGYRQSLLNENSDESGARIDNIDEFINSVFEYENANPEADLSSFLQDISLLTSEDIPDIEGSEANDNTVTLMTVHNAKGLEFPVVFLTGMEEEVFPHRFSIDTEEGIEEERRLCYVGITRAMERLYITTAEIRRSFLGVEYRQPSRFIGELPEECLEWKRHQSDSFRGTFTRMQSGSGSSRSFRREAPVQPTAQQPAHAPARIHAESASSDSSYRLSDRLIHPKFGIGTLIKIEGSGDNIKLTIMFGTTRKVFLEKYTPLERAH